MARSLNTNRAADIDEKHSMAEPVVHHLMQALLGSPAFDKYERPSDS